MTRPLRIGYVIGALDEAGSERQMLALAAGLPRDRFEPEFLLLSREGVNAPRAREAGIPVHVVPPAIRRSETRAPLVAARVARKGAEFVRSIRHGRYDIVDAWLFHAYVLAALAHPIARPSVLVTGRRSLRPREAGGIAGSILRRFAGHMSDAVVANSPQVRAEAIAAERLDPGHVRVIPNGVVIPAPPSRRETAALRAGLGISDGTIVIATVANLLPGKGHPVLLDAAARIVARTEHVRFVLVGDGHLRPELERRCAALGLSDRVSFLGSIQDAPRLLPAFDVVVQASLSEGLPNAILEAAAAGRAIVATSVGGTPEIIEAGRSGSLVRAGDPDALAREVQRLVDEPDLRARFGAAARERTIDRFGMARMVTRFAELYEELAKRKGIWP